MQKTSPQLQSFLAKVQFPVSFNSHPFEKPLILCLFAKVSRQMDFALKPHPKLGKPKGPVLVCILDGWVSVLNNRLLDGLFIILNRLRVREQWPGLQTASMQEDRLIDITNNFANCRAKMFRKTNSMQCM